MCAQFADVPIGAQARARQRTAGAVTLRDCRGPGRAAHAVAARAAGAARQRTSGRTGPGVPAGHGVLAEPLMDPGAPHAGRCRERLGRDAARAGVAQRVPERAGRAGLPGR